MSSSLKAFMHGLIDYAGLFPPANLAMEPAVKEYALFRTEPEAWMLGRFICPADRLSELAEQAECHLTTGGSWGVSALLGDRQKADKSFADLGRQCRAIAKFEQELQGLAAVEILEVPLPAQCPAHQLPGFLNSYLDGFSKAGIRGKELFLELSPETPEENERDVLQVVSDLAHSRSGSQKATLRLGAKFRCGGITSDAFPSVEKVARVVAFCRDLNLPLKCTAGLHHPVRHQAETPQVMMHGFLNVFGAGLLAHAHNFN
ncbi:MAG: hypothetical protein GY780_04625, partial [bacterium]|nr:hypothetical protein [bacterium]